MVDQKIYFDPRKAQRSFSQELMAQHLRLTLFLKPFPGVIYQQIVVAQVVLSLDLVEFHLGNQGYQVAALELGVVDLGNLDEMTELMKGYHVAALELGIVDLGNLDEMMEPMTALNYGHY